MFNTRHFVLLLTALGSSSSLVAGPGIIIPPILVNGPGSCVPFTVTLASSSTTDTFITLSINNPATATFENGIDPIYVVFPAGSTTPETRMPRVCGVNFGNATLTSSTGETGAVVVGATLSFFPAGPLTMGTSSQERLTLSLSAPAPASGLVVNLMSVDPVAATVPASVTFPANSTSVIVPVTGVASGGTAILAIPTVPTVLAATVIIIVN